MRGVSRQAEILDNGSGAVLDLLCSPLVSGTWHPPNFARSFTQPHNMFGKHTQILFTKPTHIRPPRLGTWLKKGQPTAPNMAPVRQPRRASM